MLYKLFYLFALVSIVISCNTGNNQELPILGRHEFVDTATGTDTIYHTVGSFGFLNQDSVLIANADFTDKIYVADFFFTSCPSICPLTTAQMLRLYDEFEDEDRVLLVSHTIDPEYDDVKVLSDYANRLDVSSKKWHLLTGNKEEIYQMAQTSYYVGVREEERAPGGFEHSGAFVLVDQQGRIRGMYDGTVPDKVDQLMKDMKLLLQ